MMTIIGTTPTVAKGPKWDELLAYWRTLNQTVLLTRALAHSLTHSLSHSLSVSVPLARFISDLSRLILEY
jgi:hypothetical protein